MADDKNSSSSGTQTSGSSGGTDQGTKPTSMRQIVFDHAPKGLPTRETGSTKRIGSVAPKQPSNTSTGKKK
jgi:hypothetical protein